MQQNASFKVYNASAGSGKTFALTKEYLKLLLISKKETVFRNILALTFTNKAVSEMKSRILDTLQLFSNPDILKAPNSMFSVLQEELNISPELLHEKSRVTLNTILHNYAAFDISTIDRFTHKVIRTFAFDLKLPVNFEVELDTDSLLSEAVDSLIAKAGTDQTITKTLLNFAIEKADDDKSWDISYDFKKIAKLLVSENDLTFLDVFKHNSLNDFNSLKRFLSKKIISYESQITEAAQEALTLIETSGLLFEDFTRSSLPKHFENLASKKLNIKFDNNWQIDLGDKPLYPSRVSSEIAGVIDAIASHLIEYFYTTKALVFQLKFLKNFYKNSTPLSVLSAINKELNTIKQDNNLVLISEFNTLIYDEIKDQPTPFIYERLGEKFKHYFIDEFQDTSTLQWNNLTPLINNALSTEKGSVMLVGDAKQSIYRWRGGKPELFIDLFNEGNPFQVDKQVETLPTNYRSCKQIVDFNNRFFNYISKYFFKSETHQKLYAAAQQEQFLNEEGFVNLQFLDMTPETNKDLIYPQAVLDAINTTVNNGFDFKDICILVRRKKEGIVVANYLSDNHIPLISSETLLINNSEAVTFIVNFLKLSITPEDYELKADVLYALTEQLQVDNKHDFIIKHLKTSIRAFTDALKAYSIDFSFDYLSQSSLYNASEYIIKQFDLVSSPNAYIQFFLDVVLEYSQKNNSNISDFLDYWEDKKDQLSITMPSGKNAVQIMTIHKSKGLEFPVVIYPYADLNMYREKDSKIWFPINEEAFQGFSYAFLNYNKDIEHINDKGKEIYHHKQSQLELDNINLLYVVLTRAIEQLYVISKKEKSSKSSKATTYSQLFTDYLIDQGVWNDDKSAYSFGNSEKSSITYPKPEKSVPIHRFISNLSSDTFTIVTASGLLWETEQETAIEKGNLIHYIMSKIETKKDVDFAINEALAEGLIKDNFIERIKETINSIVNHDKLIKYYRENITVYNEKDIITQKGNILRPDRVIVDQNENTTIIDYKTGVYDKKHEQQLQLYQDAIEEIPLSVTNKILVYINNTIDVKEL